VYRYTAVRHLPHSRPYRQDKLKDVEGEEQSERDVAAVAQGAGFHDEGDPGQRGEHDDNRQVGVLGSGTRARVCRSIKRQARN